MARGYRPSPRTSHGTLSACEYRSIRPRGLLPAPGCSSTLTHPRAGDGVGGARLLGSVASRGVSAVGRSFRSQKPGAPLSPGAGFKGCRTGCQPIFTPAPCALHGGRPFPIAQHFIPPGYLRIGARDPSWHPGEKLPPHTKRSVSFWTLGAWLGSERAGEFGLLGLAAWCHGAEVSGLLFYHCLSPKPW